MKIVDKNGNVVKAGDKLVTFRGEAAKFVRVVQAPTPGKSGKIETTLGVHYPQVYGVSFEE